MLTALDPLDFLFIRLHYKCFVTGRLIVPSMMLNVLLYCTVTDVCSSFIWKDASNIKTE